MKHIVTLLLFIATGFDAHAQSLRLYGVDASKYPTMSAKFFAFDAAWEQKSPTIPELFLTENRLQRTILNVTCPPVAPQSVISLAMSIDISTSMSKTVDYAKITTAELCSLVTFPTSDFALQICDDRAYIVQDFTTDKSKITNALPGIVAEGGNDFNEHLLNRLTGLLNVAKQGKNKKIAVLFTDAWWFQLTPRELQECKAICDSNKIQFFAVIYSGAETEPNGIKKSLQELATYTGGMMYDGILSKNEAKDIASKIQIAAQGSVGNCDITWESNVFCASEETDVNVVLSWNGVSAGTTYPLPSSAIASITVTPNFISFGKIPPQTTFDTTLTVKATNADFTITNAALNFGSPIFSIAKQTFPLTIPKNTSMQLTLRYSPVDSSLNYASYQLLNDKCSVEFSASGGYGGVKNKTPTLRLIQPNGGEEFLVGNDTLITWKGISATDTVDLFYSYDKGATWTKLTDNATGLSYAWTKIPKPTSANCLVKVQLKDAPPPSGIDWYKTYGGSGNEHATSIRQTNDGGYIVVGESESTDGDGGIIKGMSDLWILKLSMTGGIEWKRSYGGSRNEAATSVQQTNDGGYIVAGYSESGDGDIKTVRGSRDAWILKLSKIGAIEWQKNIGGGKDDEVRAIEQSKDGSYIAAGWSESSSGDVPINRGNSDAWVIKINPNGSLAWQNTYGGTNYDFAESITPTFDGGYIFAGHTYSSNGDITANKGFYDYWVVKIRSYGTIEWQKTFGGTGNDYAQSLRQTIDSGYIVAGRSESNNGDATFNHGSSDYWVLKLDQTGNVIWQRSYGGSGGDIANSIVQTSEGGYAVAGYSYSKDGDITTSHNGNDGWVLKLSNTGTIEWQKSCGGSKSDIIASLQQTTDDGYIIAGETNSADFEATGNKGKSDYMVIKLSSDGQVLQEDQSDAVFSIVAPQAKSHDIDMKQCAVGKYRDSLLTGFVSNSGTFPVRIDSIYFRGADANAFTLTSGLPPYSLPVGGVHAAEIRFIPKRIGLHFAQAVIITQSDTVIQLIQGEGIAPILEVLGSFIDFGNVLIDTQIDTLHIAAIRNVGTLPLSITATRHIGPNDKDFTTLTGGGNFILPPNDTAFFDLRFAPKFIGRTSGRIALDYDGAGSPAIITLFGAGVNDGAQIVAIAPQFQDLLCETQIVDTLIISNSGIDTLQIESAQITGTHATDFQMLNSANGLRIPTDSMVYLPILFTPTAAGNRIASIDIRSNTRDKDSVLSIPISGKKSNVTYTLSMQNWDVGILCPNEPIDTTLIITNTGSVDNVLYFTATNVLPGVARSPLAQSTIFTLPVRLPGRINEGVFDEILTITDSICGVSQLVHVTGTIKRTKIVSQQVADFGAIAGGSSSMLDVFAVNKDIRPIIIELPTGFAAPFTLDALVPPAGSVLAPNDTVRARIRFDAIKGVQTKGYLNWAVILPCPSMDSTELRGVGIDLDTARTTIKVQDITAQAGEKVSLTLKLQKSTGMEILGAPTEWYARIHYNKSILFNEQTRNVCTGTTDSCVLEASGIYNPNSDELLSIPCIATLGNTDHSTIVIDTFLWMNSAIATEVTRQNGTITLNGVCEDGGVRLFIPANNSTSLSTRPNPAQDKLQIHYGLREPLTVTLELLTMTGQVAQTILNNQSQATGQYTLTSDLSTLGNGVYLLRMRTNREMLTTRVDVVK